MQCYEVGNISRVSYKFVTYSVLKGARVLLLLYQHLHLRIAGK